MNFFWTPDEPPDSNRPLTARECVLTLAALVVACALAAWAV